MPDTSGPSIPEMTATWAVRNGCDATPSETSVAADVALLAFDCPPGADVELYRVADGGHSWPGSEFSSKVALGHRVHHDVDLGERADLGLLRGAPAPGGLIRTRPRFLI